LTHLYAVYMKSKA